MEMFSEIKEKMFGPDFEKPKCESAVRRAQARLNIHRNKRLNVINKIKGDIATHLKSGNEDNAVIWVETLINDEGFIICCDVIFILLDQLKGRLAAIEKFGVTEDIKE